VIVSTKRSSSSPHISPLEAASTHVRHPSTRSSCFTPRIGALSGKVDRAGYTLVPLDLHYVRGRGQDQHRPREGEEAIRQACRRKGKGLGSREQQRLLRFAVGNVARY